MDVTLCKNKYSKRCEELFHKVSDFIQFCKTIAWSAHTRCGLGNGCKAWMRRRIRFTETCFGWTRFSFMQKCNLTIECRIITIAKVLSSRGRQFRVCTLLAQINACGYQVFLKNIRRGEAIQLMNGRDVNAELSTVLRGNWATRLTRSSDSIYLYVVNNVLGFQKLLCASCIHTQMFNEAPISSNIGVFRCDHLSIAKCL